MKAFPNTNHFDDGYGMDLRDYFAAKAMQGLVCDTVKTKTLPEILAKTAYLLADAMVEARK